MYRFFYPTFSAPIDSLPPTCLVISAICVPVLFIIYIAYMADLYTTAVYRAGNVLFFLIFFPCVALACFVSLEIYQRLKAEEQLHSHNDTSKAESTEHTSSHRNRNSPSRDESADSQSDSSSTRPRVNIREIVDKESAPITFSSRSTGTTYF